MGVSAHRCDWVLLVTWSSTREPKRLPVGEELSTPCVAAAWLNALEDLELLILVADPEAL